MDVKIIFLLNLILNDIFDVFEINEILVYLSVFYICMCLC